MSQKHFTNEVFLTHVVSLDLLDYLCPVHKKEVLKVDAYRDLLNRICQQPTGAMIKEGTPLNVEPGQLVTSVSELSRVWNWHRDKVRDFVNELADRDVLMIDMHKKFMILSFPDLAERIASHAAKAGNDSSATPSALPDKSSEAKGQPNQLSSVSRDAGASTSGVASKVATFGIPSDNENRETVNPATANGGGYYQEDLFSQVNNAGTHPVSASTNQNQN